MKYESVLLLSFLSPSSVNYNLIKSFSFSLDLTLWHFLLYCHFKTGKHKHIRMGYGYDLIVSSYLLLIAFIDVTFFIVIFEMLSIVSENTAC